MKGMKLVQGGGFAGSLSHQVSVGGGQEEENRKGPSQRGFSGLQLLFMGGEVKQFF